MILTSTTETVAYTPEWRAGDAQPKYFLRSGSVIERGQMEAELAGEHRAGLVLGFQLVAVTREGVAALLADDPELDRVLGLVEAEAEHVRAVASGETAEPLAADELQLLARVRDVLAQHWPDYRELVAQQARRQQIAPIVAFARFCMGWSDVMDDKGRPVPFAKGADGRVAEASLGRVPHFELMMAGRRAFNL